MILGNKKIAYKKGQEINIDWDSGRVFSEVDGETYEATNFKKYIKLNYKLDKDMDFAEEYVEKAALGQGVASAGAELVAPEFASVIASRIYSTSLVMSVFPKITWNKSYKLQLPYESTGSWDVQASTPTATLTEDNSDAFDTLDFTAKRVGAFKYVDPVLMDENPALMPFLAKGIGKDIAEYIDTQVLYEGSSDLTANFVSYWDEVSGTTLATTVDASSSKMSTEFIDEAWMEIVANGGEPNLVILHPYNMRDIQRDDIVDINKNKGYALGKKPYATIDGMDIYISSALKENTNTHDACVMDREAMLVGIRQGLKIARGVDIEKDAEVIAGNMRMDVPLPMHPKHCAGIKDIGDSNV